MDLEHFYPNHLKRINTKLHISRLRISSFRNLTSRLHYRKNHKAQDLQIFGTVDETHNVGLGNAPLFQIG